MKIKIIILLILAFSTSCKKDHSNIDHDLVGKWTWESSVGGFSGSTYTPESTGESKTISFTSSGEMKIFLNDTLYSEEIIKTDYQIIDNSNIKYHILLINDLVFQIYSFPKTDSLILTDIMSDGYDHHYKRIE